MKKTVPLVMYDDKGERTIVGVAGVDGNTLTGTITNQRLAEQIAGLHHGAYSIDMSVVAVPSVPEVK